jgi:hypothetical protein
VRTGTATPFYSHESAFLSDVPFSVAVFTSPVFQVPVGVTCYPLSTLPLWPTHFPPCTHAAAILIGGPLTQGMLKDTVQCQGKGDMIMFASLFASCTQCVVGTSTPIYGPPLLLFFLPAFFFSAFWRSMRASSLANSCALSLRPSLLREICSHEILFQSEKCEREKREAVPQWRRTCVHGKGMRELFPSGHATNGISPVFA